jgi:hypothetical protein
MNKCKGIVKKEIDYKRIEIERDQRKEGMYYGLSTRALKSRILREVSPKGNSRDDQQETLLVVLIDDNIKLARRP